MPWRTRWGDAGPGRKSSARVAKLQATEQTATIRGSVLRLPEVDGFQTQGLAAVIRAFDPRASREAHFETIAAGPHGACNEPVPEPALGDNLVAGPKFLLMCACIV